jgi:hypothetical protein
LGGFCKTAAAASMDSRQFDQVVVTPIVPTRKLWN